MFPYCLGDMFSINMLNDIEAFDGRPRKLKDHWETIVKRTATNKDRAGDYVSSWGNTTIRDTFTIEDFFGISHREPVHHEGTDNSINFFHYIAKVLKDYYNGKTHSINIDVSKVEDGEDTVLLALVWRAQNATGSEARKLWTDVRHVIRYRLEVDKMFYSVFNWKHSDRMDPNIVKHKVKDYACLKVLI